MDSFRVLLVDDEEELVTTLVERLAYRGIEAEYALGGKRAIERMREAQFDVVVLDLKLPGMSGTEVIKAIKEEHPKVPVIMITGHGSPYDSPEEKPKEAYDYLPKPIDLEDLIEKMREAIRSK